MSIAFPQWQLIRINSHCGEIVSHPVNAMSKSRKKRKTSTDSDGLRVSYPKTKRRKKLKEEHWSDDFEDGLQAGFAAAEIASNLVMMLLRMF